MNKTEQEYEQILKYRLQTGEILFYKYEGVTLRLANRTTYKADFLVIDAQGFVELHEVKGFWEDDARAKFKMAAEIFWMFKFVAVSKKKGQFRYEVILNGECGDEEE